MSGRMKICNLKNTLLLGAAFCFSVALMQAKALPRRANFSGEWMLDTHQTKNLPKGLKSYRMLVRQNGQQLKVKTSLKGDLRPVGVLAEPYPGSGLPGSGSPVGYPGSSRGRMGGGMGRAGGMGMPGGGMAHPMGERIPTISGGNNRGGESGGESRSQRRADAFLFFPSNATYHLDHGETTARLGGPMHADATAKARWVKNGKVLKLSLEGNQYSGPSGDIQLEDRWKLSKDGQSLIVDRDFHSIRGSTTLHLVFHKQATASRTSAT